MTDTGPWSSQKIYINGTLQTSVACKDVSGNIVSRCELANTRSFNSSGDFLLMGNTYSQHNWNAKGDLGLVRIYNQELSAASVLSLYDSTSPDFTEASDTTAPTFTSSSTFSAAENIATSATAATIRVSESATVTISSGADAARFNITRSETDTAIVKFNASPDFEAPADVGGNNIYEITLTATDAASNAGTQSITITVTNVVDTSGFNSLALAGSVTTATYRTVVVVTANVSVASRVTFKVNGKVLPGCKNRLASGSSSSFSATCNWRPSNRGTVSLTAAATPTGAGISSATSDPVSILVGRRVGAR
jgi:serralysin